MDYTTFDVGYWLISAASVAAGGLTAAGMPIVSPMPSRLRSILLLSTGCLCLLVGIVSFYLPKSPGHIAKLVALAVHLFAMSAFRRSMSGHKGQL